MSGETVSFDQASARLGSSGDARHNDRSTIAFPYLDLDSGVSVAKAIYERAGLGECELHELAAQMKQVVSGALRLKTSTAKSFGFVEKGSRASFKLSELGRRVVSPHQEAQARAEAFLNIPLYKALYERYRGRILPPTKALEREIGQLGVAPKQTDKARQAFERSAAQAGYSSDGADRLVQPRFNRSEGVNDPVLDSTIEASPDELRQGGGGGGRGDPPKQVVASDSFEKELLAKFPSFDPAWSDELKAQWFKGFQQFMELAKGHSKE